MVTSSLLFRYFDETLHIDTVCSQKKVLKYHRLLSPFVLNNCNFYKTKFSKTKLRVEMLPLTISVAEKDLGQSIQIFFINIPLLYHIEVPSTGLNRLLNIFLIQNFTLLILIFLLLYVYMRICVFYRPHGTFAYTENIPRRILRIMNRVASTGCILLV